MTDARFLTVHETDDSVIAVAERRKSYRYFAHPDCEPDCIVAIVTLEAHHFLNRIRR